MENVKKRGMKISVRGFVMVLSAVTALIAAATPGMIAISDKSGQEAQETAKKSDSKVELAYDLLRQRVQFQEQHIKRLYKRIDDMDGYMRLIQLYGGNMPVEMGFDGGPNDMLNLDFDLDMSDIGEEGLEKSSMKLSRGPVSEHESEYEMVSEEVVSVESDEEEIEAIGSKNPLPVSLDNMLKKEGF